MLLKSISIMWTILGVSGVVGAIIRLLMRSDMRERAVLSKQGSSGFSRGTKYTRQQEHQDTSTYRIDPHIFLSGIKEIDIHQDVFSSLLQEVRKKIVGLDELLHSLCISLLVPGGHVLIEGVPGLAKTRTIAALSAALAIPFKRIQFTPDMLPGDLTGVDVFMSTKKQFEFVPGPLFSHMILADEINRTTPKVQSALLEAMQERQVTIGTTTYPLPQPFFVMATQNPIEQEGTYALPEAQVDRFLMKILIDYPSITQEYAMLTLVEEDAGTILPVLDAERLLGLQKISQEVMLPDEIKQYIVRLVEATRSHDYLEYGASPRASLALMRVGKALAWIEGRDSVKHRDIQRMCLPLLRHRVSLAYDVIAQGRKMDEVLVEILSSVSLEK